MRGSNRPSEFRVGLRILGLFLPTVFFTLVVAPFQPGACAWAQSNAVPLINEPLIPDAVAPGGSSFILTVSGTGFVSGSVVQWNGVPLATTFVSGSQLTANVPSSDIATPNTATVTVASPAPGGGNSNVVFLPVSAASASVSLSGSEYTLGTNPYSVTVADLKGDGILDAVVPEVSSATVSVLLGKGDGTFQAPVSYATGQEPEWVAVADFNGDGKLDLAVSDYGPPEAISISTLPPPIPTIPQ